jgi:hypothetical protein
MDDSFGIFIGMIRVLQKLSVARGAIVEPHDVKNVFGKNGFYLFVEIEQIAEPVYVKRDNNSAAFLYFIVKSGFRPQCQKIKFQFVLAYIHIAIVVHYKTFHAAYITMRSHSENQNFLLHQTNLSVN